jgi:hypothetical protein
MAWLSLGCYCSVAGLTSFCRDILAGAREHPTQEYVVQRYLWADLMIIMMTEQ